MANFITNIDLSKNELRNAKIHMLSTAPSNPANGQIYYNTTDKQPYYYNGTDWIQMNGLGATMTGSDIIAAINGASTKINKARLTLDLEVGDVSGLNNALSTIRTDITNLDTKIDTEVANLETYADTKAGDAVTTAKSYTDGQISAVEGRAAADATSKATAAETAAKTHANTKAGEAETAAKTYADTKASAAETAAKTYTNTQIADLIDGSDETLDTLKELAEAIGNDPNFATTILSKLANKPDKFVKVLGAQAVQSVNHGLDTRDVMVTIRETNAPYKIVYATVLINTENIIEIQMAVAPTDGQYTATVIG